MQLLPFLAGFPPQLAAQSAGPATGSDTRHEAEQSFQEPTSVETHKQVRPTRWGEPTEVQVGIYVIDVDEVNSAAQNFSASVYYELHWKNELLKHEGPGPQIRPATSVWTPRVAIVNQQQAWSAFPHYVEIMPDGEVIMRQKTWGWFSQPLDLKDFPLDRQTITIHLVAAGLTETQVKMSKLQKSFRKETSGIAPTFSLPDFDVEKWYAGARPYYPAPGEIGAAGFILEIDLKRKPSYFVWKIIFPLCLIVVMSWIPRWLDPKDGGTGLGISATAFLTLVAYLFAINLLLPRVSYLTRLDDFILLSTVLVFIGLLHSVLSAYFISRTGLATVLYVNAISRWVYPLLLLFIIALSFGGALGI